MAILAQWTFPTNTAGETGNAYNATTVASNLTASAVTDAGANIRIEISSNGYASDPELRALPQTVSSTSSAAAITNNCYATFNIVAATGFIMNLTSLTYNAARGGTSTPRGTTVRSSIDNYAANIYTADLATVRPNWTAVNISLTGAAYQGISAITFRLYIYTTSTTSSNEIDDITINGDLIPPKLKCVSVLEL